MSDTNRVGLYLSVEAESTYGEDISNPVAPNALCITGESLTGNTASTESQKIRSDRNISAHIRTGLSGGGDINSELAAVDDIASPVNEGTTHQFMDTLQSSFTAWSTSFYTKSGITESSNEFTGTAMNTDLAVGDYFIAKSATDDAIFGIYKVVSFNTTVGIVSEPICPTTTATDIELRAVTDAELRANGTTFRSRNLLKVFEDKSTMWSSLQGERHNGLAHDGLTITVPTDGIVTYSFSTLSKRATPVKAADYSTGANDWSDAVAAPTEEPMNSIDHVCAAIDGAYAANSTQLNITGLTIQVANNLRSRLEVGSLGAKSIGSGFCQVTGTLQAYFEDAQFLEENFEWGNNALIFGFMGPSNEGYIIQVKKTKITQVTQVAGGVNQDVIVDMTWGGFVDSTGASTGTIFMGAFV